MRDGYARQKLPSARLTREGGGRAAVAIQDTAHEGLAS